MKNLILSTLIFILSGTLSAQKINFVKTITYSESDTIPKVIYPEEKEKNLYVINDKKYTSPVLLKSIHENDIESISAERTNEIYRGKTYAGKLIFKSKRTFKPKIISVSDLILKYTNLPKDSKFIFSIDEEIMNDDAKNTEVDEKNIMKIAVTKLDKSIPDIYFIKILTRSKENLKKANEIIIRGTESK